ncbi:deaminase [Pantoea sp. Eser]|nr:deaminase [Pantoea sp. Eser]
MNSHVVPPVGKEAKYRQRLRFRRLTYCALPHQDRYLLRNVRLEEGFEREGDEIIATRTALYDLSVRDGKIDRLQPAGQGDPSLPAWDAQGALLLPHSQARAEGLIALLNAKGTTRARSHCNIDPVSGLQSLDHLQAALTNHPAFPCEIVAFPQHGLLHSQVDGLMREAMQRGVQYVGGLDPTNVDGAMEKSLDAMFQIALDYQRGVDIHLHETSAAGVAAIQYMIDTVARNPALKGKATLSHGFALATLEGSALERMIEGLAEQQFSVAYTLPIGKLTMPIPQLQAVGINVMTGTDSVIDHWSPFGTGSMLEKANLYAQLYRGSDEFSLSRALAIATGNQLPLSAKGERQWPKSGDEASMMLVAASCSAETVARISPVVATFSRSKAVFALASA